MRMVARPALSVVLSSALNVSVESTFQITSASSAMLDASLAVASMDA